MLSITDACFYNYMEDTDPANQDNEYDYSEDTDVAYGKRTHRRRRRYDNCYEDTYFDPDEESYGYNDNALNW